MSFKVWLKNQVVNRPKVRRFLLRLSERNRDLDIQLIDTSLRINSHKEHGYLRASRLAELNSVFGYETSILLTLSHVLRSGDTFVDCGANVGLFVKTLARFRKLEPSIRYYAFEANPDTFQRLTTGLDPAIQAYNFALAERDMELKFVEGFSSGVFTLTDRQSAMGTAERFVTIPGRRLDSFPIEGNSLVLKVDVEGQELEVLKGASGLFDAKRIRCVYVDGFNDKSLPQFLKDRGFRFYDGRTLEPSDGSAFCLLALRANDA